MKLYKVVILKNGKKECQATGDNLDKLIQWAKDCQKEDTNIKYEIYKEV